MLVCKTFQMEYEIVKIVDELHLVLSNERSGKYRVQDKFKYLTDLTWRKICLLFDRC